MWNGYTEDTWQAAAACKETWEDERIWFPKLVDVRYGPMKKTRAQIIAEHCIEINRGVRRVIAKKVDGKLKVTVYRSDAFWIRRMEELSGHAYKTWHEKRFNKMLNVRDIEGKTAFIAACANNTLSIVNYLIKKGVSIWQKTNEGKNGAEMASKKRKDGDTSVRDRLAGLGVKYDPDKVRSIREFRSLEYAGFDDIFNHWQNIRIQLYVPEIPVREDTAIEAAIKRQRKQERAAAAEKKKSSLYKQQFGGRR